MIFSTSYVLQLFIAVNKLGGSGGPIMYHYWKSASPKAVLRISLVRGDATLITNF